MKIKTIYFDTGSVFMDKLLINHIVTQSHWISNYFALIEQAFITSLPDVKHYTGH